MLRGIKSRVFVATMLIPAVSGLQAEPLGYAFTYQGQLVQDGVPAHGLFDLEFALWDSEFAGTLLDVRTLELQPVTRGLFAVSLDFGMNVLDGRTLWLEVSVRPHASGSVYTTLEPRQRLAPSPYALALPGLRTQQNNDSPNLVGGWNQNDVTEGVVGATIGGGGGVLSDPLPNRVTDNYSAVGGGVANVAGNDDDSTSGAAFATVAGGHSNQAANWGSFVGGGHLNLALGNESTVSGGSRNEAVGSSATIGGGQANEALGVSSSVGGGGLNAAWGDFAVVPGGWSNQAGGYFSLAAGRRAIVRDATTTGDANGDEGTFVWADSTDADFASTGPDQFLIRAGGGVGIGTNEPSSALSVVGNANFSGKLGIGTDVATADLDVVSSSPLSTTVNVVNTSSAQRFLFQVNGNDPGSPNREGNLEIIAFGPDSIYNVLTATPDGAVGIRTSSPRNAFSVDGVADFAGPVGIGTATPTAHLDVVSSHTNGTGLDIKNTASAQRFLLQVNGTTPGGLNREGNFEIWGTGASGNFNVFAATPEGNVGIGTQTPAESLSVDGVVQSMAGGFKFPDDSVLTSADGANIWAKNGTAAYYNDGLVGIGTSSPGYRVPNTKFEVLGGHVAIGNNFGVFSSNAAGDGIGAGFDTGHDDTLDLYAGGSKRVRFTAAGKVGIGTDSPAEMLSVAGDALFTDKVRIGNSALGYTLTNTALEISEGNIMLGNAGGIVTVNSAGTGIGAGFRTGTSGDLYLYGNGAVRMHIAPDGKVGIGSSPPSHRLTVGGAIQSTSVGFVCPDGSTLSSAEGANIWSKNGSSAYYNDGNIGIGRSDPQDEVDILNGDITLDTGASGSSALRFRYDGALRWTFLYRSWATNEFGLYNESAGTWGMTFRTDTNYVGIGRSDAQHPLHVGTGPSNGNGAHLTAGGVWTNGSDRDSKQRFEPIDTADILAKVVDLPLSRWQYKGEEPGVRHIGPMAQDFYVAFGLGASDKYIGTIDADGVALAALQGLHERLRQKERELDELRKEKDARLAAHEERLAELTRRLSRVEDELHRLKPD